MARARNIKPGFFKNEVLGVADPLYSILFEGLWVLADREGRLEDRPLRIKGEVFPYRDGLDMEAMLDWLQDNGFIRRYLSAGKRCILVLEFVKHQNPHKNETASELPAPEEIGTAPEKIGSARADSLSTDSLNSDPLKGPSGPEVGELFDKFWEAYPRKVGKDAARKAFEKRKPTQTLLDEMLAALGWQRKREQWTKDGGQYIPHPSTWLNEGRWQDTRTDDRVSITVPGPTGPDPELAKIKAHKGTPIPPEIAARMAALKGKTLQ